MDISKELRGQIEAAYDYRGHVTLALKDGSQLEGYLYNRFYAHPKSGESFYVDVMVKNQEERRRIPMSEIRSISLSGEDCAAGKSYADYIAKQNAAKA